MAMKETTVVKVSNFLIMVCQVVTRVFLRSKQYSVANKCALCDV